MKRRTLALAIAGAALTMGLTAGTFATWISADTAVTAPFTSGTLHLRTDSVMGLDAPVWIDASVPGKTVIIDPDTFLASAGDVIRMGHYFTLDASGDNLTYQLDVRWDAPPALTDGVTATYTLTEDPGTGAAVVHISRAALGTPVTLPTETQGTRKFLLDIELTYADTRADRTEAQAALTDIGQVTISARQIREGAQR